MATDRALRRRCAAKVRNIEKHRRFDELATSACLAPQQEVGGQLHLLRALLAAISAQAADSVLAGFGPICSFIIFFISFTVGSAL